MGMSKTWCRRLWIGLCVGVLAVGVASDAQGQRAQTRADTLPVVTAGFTDQRRPANPAFSQTAGGCISLFERELTMYAYNHPPDLTPAHDTLINEEGNWVPYPADAIAAGRQCLHLAYPTLDKVADADLATLWPLVAALNEDSLVPGLVMRRLALTGAEPSTRAALLVQVIRDLILNATLGSGGLTDGHIALARRYLAQLEAMGPAQVLAWLEARDVFQNAVARRLDSDSSIQAAIAEAQHTVAVLHSIPDSILSNPDRARLRREAYLTRTYGVQWLTYLKTLAHADLTRFVQLVDSGWQGGKRPWLVGTPAPPLTADYWFGTPSNAAPSQAPAPNAVSLIVFVDPRPGQPVSGHDALLRRLHSKVPTLPIILIAVTHGAWANESLLGHPEREAQLMYHYVHDSLQVPGIMGVLKGKQQVATTDGQTLPVQLPMFEHYMVDVRDLNGQSFLVDPDGWVVDQRTFLPLIQRLVAKFPPSR